MRAVGKGSRRKKERQQERAEQERLKLQEFWHGGVAGLNVGDVLDKAYWQDPHATDAGRILRMPSVLPAVFITPDQKFAESYSAEAGLGDLYKVVPRGDLREDPDYQRGLSYSCDSAEIIEVVQRGVVKTRENQMAGHRPMTWAGGGRMYDEEGHMLPSPKMQSMGITREHLRGYGFLPPFDMVNADLTQRMMYGQLPVAPR